MHVTLVHNPGAGDGGPNDGPHDLVRTIRAAGHTVDAVSCTAPRWTDALLRPTDLVAVHGGDGTVGGVGRRMIGRGIPLAALAAGTANNIAMTLGTQALSIPDQVRAWTGARRIAFDACVARGPFGTRHLLEGLGLGLFAWAMKVLDDGAANHAGQPQARIARALSMLSERVAAHPSIRVQATLDGNDLSGDYVVLEAMNTQFIGPNLFLAPEGHPGDGLLDVVTVSDDARAAFGEKLESWKRGALQPHPWPAHRGRHLTLRWTGFPMHLDDEAWPDGEPEDPAESQRVDVEVLHAALEFLVPADHAHPPIP